MSKFFTKSSKTQSDLEKRIDQGFTEVGDAIDIIGVFLPRHVAPPRPQNGKLYFADGTDWDPGSGRGVYIYDAENTNYRHLG